MQKTLYIVRGPAGSGKSTYCQKVLLPKIFEETGAKIENRENDAFFTDACGNYNWDPKKMWLAIKICRGQVQRDLEKYGVAVVSNTFIDMSSMKDYFKLAEDMGAEVKVIRMGNWYGSIHGVPEDKIQQMKDNMVDVPGEEIVK